jgi:molybdopterin biosynthesis enzyme
VRDVNTHTIYSQVTACGGKPVSLGLAADDKKDLTRKVEISMRKTISPCSREAPAWGCAT